MSIFREFNISMIPGKPPLIVHASQYESDFVYTFHLVSGKSVLAIPNSAIAVIRGTKRDGNGFSKEASLDTENNKVVVIGEVQMTACAGRNVFELAIINDEKTICTANFFLDVERAPLDSDTITSETVLHDLQAIIDSAAIATQAAEAANASAEEAAESARTLTIDPTLTQSGQAADAKVVGDEIADLKSDLDNIYDSGGENIAVIDASHFLDDELDYGGFASIVYSDGGFVASLIDTNQRYVGYSLPTVQGTDYKLSFKVNYISATSPSGTIKMYICNSERLDPPSAILNETLNSDTEYTYEFTATSNLSSIWFSVKKSETKVSNIIVCDAIENWGYKNLDDTFTKENRPPSSYAVGQALASIQASDTKDIDAFVYKKSGIIPSYYFNVDDAQNYLSQEYLEQKIASIPKGKHCIFYTDVHWATNQKNSTALIEYIRKRTGIETVICGGDILNLDDSKYTASKNLAMYVNEVASAVGDNLLIAMGDHDNNTANYQGDNINDVMLPFSIIEKWFMTPIENKVQRQSKEELDTLFSSIPNITEDDKNELIAYMCTHFYVDDAKQKIRYIVLTSGVTNNGVINTYFEINATTELSMQFEWLYETLMSVSDDYDVIIVSHNTIDIYDASPDFISTATTRLHRIASAFKGKGSYSVTIGGGNATFQSMFGGSKTFDFANANNVNNVIILGGDTHINIDCVFGQGDGFYSLRRYSDATIGTNDILTVTTQTDNSAQHNQYVENDSMGESSRMTNNTITEQAIDVLTIGENNVITFTRIGAGVDRMFDMSVT